MADTVEPVPTNTTQKITFGELRETDVHHELVYCRDHKCSHHVEVSADRWPDHVRLSAIVPSFTCTEQRRMAATWV